MDSLERINAHIKEQGFNYTVTQSDAHGEIVPCKRDGNNFWFALHVHGDGHRLHMADYPTQTRRDLITATPKSLSTLDKAAARQAKKDFAEKKLRQQLQAQEQVQDLYARESVGPTMQSDYLIKKGLTHEPPAYTILNPFGNHRLLVVPMYDSLGNLWNLQKIPPVGKKMFHTNGRVKGLSHLIAAPDVTSNVMLLGEGYATVLAAVRATGCQGAVAFDCGNLEAVLRQLLTEWAPEKIVLLADWDGATFEKTGKNPGMLECQRLALKYKVKVAVPGRPEGEGFDFADLYGKDGDVEAVLCAVQSAIGWEELSQEAFEKPAESEPPRETISELMKDVIKQAATKLNGDKPVTPVDIPDNALFRAAPKAEEPGQPLVQILKGVSQYDLPNRTMPLIQVEQVRGSWVIPPEVDVARVLLKYFDGYMVKFSGNVYLYDGLCWSVIDEEDDSFLYKIISETLHNKANHKKLKDIVAAMKLWMPTAPRNLSTPNPSTIAFLNGTLCVTKRAGNWEIVFREHRADDYCTTIIPHRFDESLVERNEAFEKMLDRVLPDKESQRALAQMYGACLAPVFPRLFMLVGKPGRGKSTVLNTAINLVSEKNISSVLPSDFNNFMAEGMIGKLVNVDGDIPSEFAISDSVIKKVEDRMPVSINRKGRKVVRTLLPPIHIFGANVLPPTFERSIGAHKRRWTFIEFDAFNAEKAGDYDKEIGDSVLAHGIGGIINFALRGLRDLLDAKGHYFMKESAKKRLVQWQIDNDSVAMFIEDMRTGQVIQHRAQEDGLISRTDMWRAYQQFMADAFPSKRIGLSRNKFYQALRDKEIPEAAAPSGMMCFVGFVHGQSHR